MNNINKEKRDKARKDVHELLQAVYDKFAWSLETNKYGFKVIGEVFDA